MRLGLVCLDTWPAVTRVLSRSRERTLGTRLLRSQAMFWLPEQAISWTISHNHIASSGLVSSRWCFVEVDCWPGTGCSIGLWFQAKLLVLGGESGGESICKGKIAGLTNLVCWWLFRPTYHLHNRFVSLLKLTEENSKTSCRSKKNVFFSFMGTVSYCNQELSF